MKIAFFTNDFKNIAFSPKHAKYVLIFEIDKNKKIIGKKKMLISNNCMQLLSNYSNCNCNCKKDKRWKQYNYHKCVNLNGGLIEINEKIPTIDIVSLLQDCNNIFVYTIGYGLMQKLLTLNINVIFCDDSNIEKNLNNFLKNIKN